MRGIPVKIIWKMAILIGIALTNRSWCMKQDVDHYKKLSGCSCASQNDITWLIWPSNGIVLGQKLPLKNEKMHFRKKFFFQIARPIFPSWEFAEMRANEC